jgi:uncharacterized membrane protein
MHVLTWASIGALVGAVARLSGTRRASALGLVTAGVLGGLLGGLGFRALAGEGASAPAHGIVAAAGAAVLVALLAVLARTGQRPESPEAPRRGLASLDAQIARLGDLERRVLARVLRRETLARDTAEEFEARLTFGERMADRLATFGGSWSFLGLFASVLIAWMFYNSEHPKGFDPYPFILLNLVLSCLAAVQAPVIMMSQNRMAAKDRLDARHDYEVNLKAEMEILAVHAKLEELQAAQAQRFAALETLHGEIADRVERALGGERT